MKNTSPCRLTSPTGVETATGYVQSVKTIFLFNKSERGKVEEVEPGDWNDGGGKEGGGGGGKRVDMLNGACKYRERRDTKGAPKRSMVRARRVKAERGKGERCTWSVHRVSSQKDSARWYPPGKEGPERGRGQYKGLF